MRSTAISGCFTMSCTAVFEYMRASSLWSAIRFARIGSILVNKPEEADYIAEVASGCLGTEDKKTVIGPRLAGAAGGHIHAGGALLSDH